MKNVYLILAVAGTILPYFFFAQFLGSAETSLSEFVSQLFATPPASGFTTDLLVTSLAFWVWSFFESRRQGMSRWWTYVVLNLVIGLSCAFPLFLYVRERKLEQA